MIKAAFTTKGGVTVSLEGRQDEVKALIECFENSKRAPASPASAKPRAKKTTLMGLLAELVSDQFFATPRELGGVKRALEEMGHFYPATTLSPTLLRLVRRKHLRRIKEKGRWLYVAS